MNREVHVLDLWGRAGEIPARYPAVHAPSGLAITPRTLCVPRTSSKSCDQAIFADQATDASCFRMRYCSRLTGSGTGVSGAAPCRERCGRCWLWWGLVLAQDPPQMVLVPDQGAVQELASASTDPAFGDRVHAGRPHVA